MKDLTNKKVKANYRKGTQTYIGSLILYSDNFEYKATAVNSDISLGKIPYSEIITVKPANTFGIIPNGVSVKLKNGSELNYVVNNRKALINFLVEKMSNK